MFSANFPPNITGPENIVITMETEAVIHVTAFDINNDTFKLRVYGLPDEAFVTYGKDFVTVKWRVASFKKVGNVTLA